MQLLVHNSYSRPKFLIIMTLTTLTKMWTTMLDIRRNIGGALVAAQEIECGAPPTHPPANQSQKNLGSRVALVSGKFLQQIYYWLKDDCVSGLSKKCLDELENFGMILKVYS